MAAERRYDIDWVRVIGMLLVFVFHCTRFFDDEGWHVKNDELADWATAFVQVTWRFMMPLFFVVSAIAAYYSLGSRTGGQYLASRIKRLVVPFLFGTFVVLMAGNLKSLDGQTAFYLQMNCLVNSQETARIPVNIQRALLFHLRHYRYWHLQEED